MTFGFSRDDAAKFLGAYYENKIYESDPFQHLDQVGVGKLVKMAAHDGRETRPDLGLGICGEHGGDPSSVEFCHNVGLDYVSCSPSVCLSHVWLLLRLPSRTPASNGVRLEKARIKHNEPPRFPKEEAGAVFALTEGQMKNAA